MKVYSKSQWGCTRNLNGGVLEISMKVYSKSQWKYTRNLNEGVLEISMKVYSKFQWRCTWNFLKLQSWFNVISRTLVAGGGLTPQQWCSQCILEPRPTGLVSYISVCVEYYFIYVWLFFLIIQRASRVCCLFLLLFLYIRVIGQDFSHFNWCEFISVVFLCVALICCLMVMVLERWYIRRHVGCLIKIIINLSLRWKINLAWLRLTIKIKMIKSQLRHSFK